MADNILPEPGADQGHQMPSAEELLAAIEQMSELSDGDKAELRDSLLKGAADKVAGAAGGYMPPSSSAAGSTGTVEVFILLVMISLVFLVLVFFGYKLYKGLDEREKKREEKRLQKQNKKKK